MALKLLKFDVVHPHTYLEKKKKQWTDLNNLSLAEYRQRLIKLRSNYSDFYTYYLTQMGWEAEEFYLNDETFLDKAGEEMFGPRAPLEKLGRNLISRFRPPAASWRSRVIRAYVQKFKPDVIFVRSQPMPSHFWQRFRGESMLVARLSARLPRQWHPDDWDLIYTDLESFKTFFEAHKASTYLNRQGFDTRINEELTDRPPRHEVIFIGGMGTQNFLNRTRFFEELAKRINFKWWGYWWKYGGWGSLDNFPHLKKTFQGPTSGLEMYQLYKDSKIVMNDYVDTSQNIGFNQRMFEAMGVGSFMLTRQADNFKEQFPDDIFGTFSDVQDCAEKINYYLEHSKERQTMGQNAKKFVAKHYNYQDIVRAFDKELREELAKQNVNS